MPTEPKSKGRQHGRRSPLPSIGTSRRRRPAPETPLLSVEEAAELLGQSRSSLYRAIKKGCRTVAGLQDRWPIPHPEGGGGALAQRRAAACPFGRSVIK